MGNNRMKNSTRISTRNRHLCGASLVGLALAAIATGAYAQEDASALEEVVITGSRTVRDGSQAPTPVTVITVEQLANSAPRDLAQALSALPAFANNSNTNTPTFTATNNNQGSFLNMRGMGARRTLVLLDGRRLAPTAGDGTVDFQMLPQSLVSRIDVVTGGASAVYGSDAVAGVVNVILDTRFTGIKGSVQGGISDKGDVGSYRVNLTAGGRYLNDRLTVLASYGHSRSNQEPNAIGARRWANSGAARLSLGTGATQYSDIFLDVNQRNYPGGLVLPGAGPANLFPVAGQGIKFINSPVGGPAFTSVYDIGTFDPRTGVRLSTTNNQQGGDGTRNAVALTALGEVTTTFARATYDFSDTWSVYVQGMAGQTYNVAELSADQHFGTGTFYTIFEGNPYLPPNIAAALAAATVTDPGPVGGVSGPVGNYTLAFQNTCNAAASLAAISQTNRPNGTNIAKCFQLARYNNDNPRIYTDVLNNSFDLTTGFQGEIFGKYRLSGYYGHGQSRYRTETRENFIQERGYAAMDVVANPAVNGVPGVAAGTPVCRVSLTNPTLYPGCQPHNPFGYGSTSQAANDYMYGTSLHRLKTRQDVVALDLAGDVFELPAGSIAGAIGVERRQLYVQQITDALSQRIKQGTGIRGYPANFVNVIGGYSFTNQQPYSGSFTVQELYGELDIPLLKDLPLAQDASINLAGRYTDYSTSGGVKTYKIGLDYRPVESVRFRGTYSRDIRAPSPLDLFQGGSQGTAAINDPFKGGQVTNIFTATVGNRNLQPEIADTYAAGVVLTPTWVPGVTVSVDWYSIAIEEAIGSLSVQQVIDFCFLDPSNTALCSNVARGASTDPAVLGNVARITSPFLNLTELETSGVDVELSYRRDLTLLPGTLTTRLLMTYLDTYVETAPGGGVTIATGQIGNGNAQPRLKGQASMNWDAGPVTLFAQAKYIGHGVIYKQLTESGLGPNTIIDNRVGSHLLFDLTGKYRFGEDSQYEAFLTIQNLFDKDPKIAPGTNVNTVVPTNTQLYDSVGRYYTTGLRFRF